MTEKTFLVPELEAGHSGESVSETEGEIYGIGIEKKEPEICSGFTKKYAGRPETELFLIFHMVCIIISTETLLFYRKTYKSEDEKHFMEKSLTLDWGTDEAARGVRRFRNVRSGRK